MSPSSLQQQVGGTWTRSSSAHGRARRHDAPRGSYGNRGCSSWRCAGTAGAAATHRRRQGSLAAHITPMAPWQAAGSISSKPSTRCGAEAARPRRDRPGHAAGVVAARARMCRRGQRTGAATRMKQHPQPEAAHSTCARAPTVVTRRQQRRPPAAASTIASSSPLSSIARRASMLPRTGTTFRCGCACSSCALRRMLLVPTRAPCGSSAVVRPCGGGCTRDGWRAGGQTHTYTHSHTVSGARAGGLIPPTARAFPASLTPHTSPVHTHTHTH